MKSKRGRPKGPETVMFRMRIPVYMGEAVRLAVRSFLEGTVSPSSTGAVRLPDSGCEELKAQMKMLLEDNDRLQKEVDLFVVKRDNWMRATESQRVNAAMREVDKWKKAYLDGRSEFSQ